MPDLCESEMAQDVHQFNLGTVEPAHVTDMCALYQISILSRSCTVVLSLKANKVASYSNYCFTNLTADMTKCLLEATIQNCIMYIAYRRSGALETEQ